MAQEKKFVTSTCDALLFKIDINSGDEMLVAEATTTMNSSLEQAVNKQIIRGGIGAKKQFEYANQKELTMTFQDCQFRESFLAFAQGGEMISEMRDYYDKEELTITNGKGTLTTSKTLLNDYVNVLRQKDGTKQKVAINKSTKAFDLGNSYTGKATVVFKYSKTAKHIPIYSDVFAGVYKVILQTDVYSDINGASDPIERCQITIPRYQVNDNISMTFDMANPYVSSLNGSANNFDDNGKSYLAMVDIFTNEGVTDKSSLASISATPSILNMNVGDTQILEVIGYGGNGSLPVTIENKDITFTPADSATATCASDGTVEAIKTGQTDIDVTYNSGGIDFKDIVRVVIT